VLDERSAWLSWDHYHKTWHEVSQNDSRKPYIYMRVLNSMVLRLSTARVCNNTLHVSTRTCPTYIVQDVLKCRNGRTFNPFLSIKCICDNFYNLKLITRRVCLAYRLPAWRDHVLLVDHFLLSPSPRYCSRQIDLLSLLERPLQLLQ